MRDYIDVTGIAFITLFGTIVMIVVLLLVGRNLRYRGIDVQPATTIAQVDALPDLPDMNSFKFNNYVGQDAMLKELRAIRLLLMQIIEEKKRSTDCDDKIQNGD